MDCLIVINKQSINQIMQSFLSFFGVYPSIPSLLRQLYQVSGYQDWIRSQTNVDMSLSVSDDYDDRYWPRITKDKFYLKVERKIGMSRESTKIFLIRFEIDRKKLSFSEREEVWGLYLWQSIPLIISIFIKNPYGACVMCYAGLFNIFFYN
jgi:hypothetical protein